MAAFLSSLASPAIANSLQVEYDGQSPANDVPIGQPITYSLRTINVEDFSVESDGISTGLSIYVDGVRVDADSGEFNSSGCAVDSSFTWAWACGSLSHLGSFENLSFTWINPNFGASTVEFRGYCQEWPVPSTGTHFCNVNGGAWGSIVASINTQVVSLPQIELEKATNGVDADDPNAGDAPQLAPGDPVTWTYVVTNTGDTPLVNVSVTDDQIGPVSCPQTTLAVLESMTCTASGTAEVLLNTAFTTVPGTCGGIPNIPLYENRGLATGESQAGAPVQDEDPSHYCNPPQPPTLEIVDKMIVGEDVGQAMVTVTRSGSPENPIVASYETKDGTATSSEPNMDFDPSIGQLFWEAGDNSSRLIPINILDDQMIEGNETFFVVLFDVSGASTTNDVAEITIKDNDALTSLTLVKEVVGGNAVANDWTLTADGTDDNDLSGAGGASGEVNPDTFSLSESAGPAGYVASDWVCEGGLQAGSEITLSQGDSATCTITNTTTNNLIFADGFENHSN